MVRRLENTFVLPLEALYAEFRLAAGRSNGATGVSEIGAKCAKLSRLRLFDPETNRVVTAIKLANALLAGRYCLKRSCRIVRRSLMDSSLGRLYPPQLTTVLLVSRPRANTHHYLRHKRYRSRATSASKAQFWTKDHCCAPDNGTP